MIKSSRLGHLIKDIRLRLHINNTIHFQEVLQTHNGMIWFDASVRFTSPNLVQNVLTHTVNNGGFTMLSCPSHSVYSVVHPMMYDYLPTNRSLLKYVDCCQGGALIIYYTEDVFYDVLWPLFLCALQKWCIAPTRRVDCDWRKLQRRNLYADCHR